jgi:hypothetical protein
MFNDVTARPQQVAINTFIRARLLGGGPYPTTYTLVSSDKQYVHVQVHENAPLSSSTPSASFHDARCYVGLFASP